MNQGLKDNWKQFAILVFVNGLVGAILGLERSVLPELLGNPSTEKEFSILFSLILIFGLSKALTNYFTGRFSQTWGRKKLLVLGWLIAVPIPLFLMFGESWISLCLANVFLGVSQGLTWSSTVIMKIDLVGEKQRGLALGINESIGYVAVAVSAFVTASITENIGVQPYPFYLGLFYVSAGLLVSSFFVRDTSHFVKLESRTELKDGLKNVFVTTTFRDKNLSAITQGGIVNNLNDGMLWGILPLLLLERGFALKEIGLIVAIYPAIWGLGQLFTGMLSDRYNLKLILVSGMALQGVSLCFFPFTVTFLSFTLASVGLGLGTALVYPNFLVAISRNCPAVNRAECIGVYRLWRDLGYVFGAILSALGMIYFGMSETVIIVAALTLLSALIIQFRFN